MSETPNTKVILYKAVLDAYREEYEELYQTWRNIDTKAQGTVAIAGIFLAALFAFVRGITPQDPMWQSGLLAFSGCALGISVFVAVLVLRVRGRLSPQIGKNVDVLVTDLVSTCDERELQDRFPAFLSNQLMVWRTSVAQLEQEVLGKADHLLWAQFFLAVGVTVIGLLTIFVVAASLVG